MRSQNRIIAVIEQTRNRFFVILKQGKRTLKEAQASDRREAEALRKDLLAYARKSGLDLNRY